MHKISFSRTTLERLCYMFAVCLRFRNFFLISCSNSFYRAMLCVARIMPSQDVCPSVCLSVCHTHLERSAPHVTSTPSLPVFRSRLKTHLFRRCFPWLHLLFFVVPVKWLVIIGHVNRSFYFYLLQRTVCQLQRDCSSTAAANSEQCRSFGLLRTSLQSRCTTAALVTLVAGYQTHKVQVMRPDVRRFPWHGARVPDWFIKPR